MPDGQAAPPPRVKFVHLSCQDCSMARVDRALDEFKEPIKLASDIAYQAMLCAGTVKSAQDERDELVPGLWLNERAHGRARERADSNTIPFDFQPVADGADGDQLAANDFVAGSLILWPQGEFASVDQRDSEIHPTPAEIAGPSVPAAARAIRVPKGRMKAGQSSGLPLPAPPTAIPAPPATPANKPAAPAIGASASTTAPALMTPPAQLAFEQAKAAKESGEKLPAAEWRKIKKEKNREQKRLSEAALAAGPSADPSPSSPASPSPPVKPEREAQPANDPTALPTAATAPEGAVIASPADSSPDARLALSVPSTDFGFSMASGLEDVIPPKAVRPPAKEVWTEPEPDPADTDRNLFGDRSIFDPRVHEVPDVAAVPVPDAAAAAVEVAAAAAQAAAAELAAAAQAAAAVAELAPAAQAAAAVAELAPAAQAAAAAAEAAKAAAETDKADAAEGPAPVGLTVEMAGHKTDKDVEAQHSTERSAAAALAEEMRAEKAKDVERQSAAERAGAALKIAELQAEILARQRATGEDIAKEVDRQVASERAAFALKAGELETQLRAQERRAHEKALDLATANMALSILRAQVKEDQQTAEAAMRHTIEVEEDLLFERRRAAVLADDREHLLARVAQREADAVEVMELCRHRPTAEAVEEQVGEHRALVVRLQAENEHLATTISLQGADNAAQVEELAGELGAERAKLRSATARHGQLETTAAETETARAEAERAAGVQARRFHKELTAAQSKQAEAEADATDARNLLAANDAAMAELRYEQAQVVRECVAVRRQVESDQEEREVLERHLAEMAVAARGAGHVHRLIGLVDADVAGGLEDFAPPDGDAALVDVPAPVAAPGQDDPPEPAEAAPIVVRPLPARTPWLSRPIVLLAAVLLVVMAGMAAASSLAAERERRLWACANALPEWGGEAWFDPPGGVWGWVAWAAGACPGVW
ncbi:MAG: hypothetical protein M1826_004558 [Phylliscum demangeonii]|nr:MAG: hypothetical protein M1826_004558 [Phylliscum demangeonii]